MNTNTLNPLINHVEKATQEIILKFITNEEVKQLTIDKFPDNLKKEDVDSYFYRALNVFHPEFIHYLITTEKNQIKFNFQDSLVDNIYNSYAKEIPFISSGYTESLAFILKYEQFTNNISVQMANNIIKIGLESNNQILIDFALEQPEWKQYFKKHNCFQKASKHGNAELLEKLFSDTMSYTNLSEESVIRNCVFECVDKKNFDTLFYLLYVRNIEITDNIHKICSKDIKSKDMLEQCINFKKLDYNVTQTNKVNMNIKKKI